MAWNNSFLHRYVSLGNHDHRSFRANNQVNIGDPRWYMPTLNYYFKKRSQVGNAFKAHIKGT